jgi:hypothetical protein
MLKLRMWWKNKHIFGKQKLLKNESCIAFTQISDFCGT